MAERACDGPRGEPATRPRGAAVGADVGATLVKLAMRDARGAHLPPPPCPPMRSTRWRSGCAISPRAGSASPVAARRASAERLAQPPRRPSESSRRWAAGARQLLGREPPQRFLVVSVGTGTSALLVRRGPRHARRRHCPRRRHDPRSGRGTLRRARFRRDRRARAARRSPPRRSPDFGHLPGRRFPAARATSTPHRSRSSRARGGAPPKHRARAWPHAIIGFVGAIALIFLVSRPATPMSS